MCSTKVPQCGSDAVANVTQLFAANGDSQYGGEAVSQREHALQAACLAEQEDAGSELIVAALLHDIGHLLHDLANDAPNQGIDDQHELLGCKWLSSRFPAEVVEPIRLHVTAKRYLCAVEAGYWDSLSGPSKQSLELQGGAMTEEECEQFRTNPHFDAAIRLRRWDDQAKVANLKTPPVDHFLQYIAAVA